MFHIVHADRLQSVLGSGFLFSDAQMRDPREGSGTVIGFPHIKERRLNKPIVQGCDLKVGGCVPFYFCPRSVMLYVIWRGNHPELSYSGGQGNVIHLVFDPVAVANWAIMNGLRYFITDVSAACDYFTAYPDLDAMNRLDWQSINAHSWSDCTDRKQAEFLCETKVPTSLLCGIGVMNQEVRLGVVQSLKMHGLDGKVDVAVMPNWYY